MWENTGLKRSATQLSGTSKFEHVFRMNSHGVINNMFLTVINILVH